MNQGASSCGGGTPAINETVDDLKIYVEIVAIDGVNGVLGSAGPCFLRSGSNLTIVGKMRFDSADITSLESGGNLLPVILHEMGHVLGVGTRGPSPKRVGALAVGRSTRIRFRAA